MAGLFTSGDNKFAAEQEDEEEEEEIAWNPVFTQIREGIDSFEKLACEEGWIVLVPSQVGLAPLPEGKVYSKIFLQRHVMYPSPYLRNEFVSFGGDRATIDSGIIVVRTGEGYGHLLGKVHILREEPMYVSSCGSYKALLVDKPIQFDSSEAVFARKSQSRVVLSPSQPSEAPVSPTFPEDGKAVFDEQRPVDEWMKILYRDTSNGIALRYLEEYTDNLKRSYVLVANKVGISDFTRKMGAGISAALNLLIEKNQPRYGAAAHNKKYNLILRRALEAYAFMGVHELVFQSLVKLYADQERVLRANASLRREGVSSSVLERNSKEFFVDLNQRSGPMAKLEFLRDYFSASTRSGQLSLSADVILDTLVEKLIHIPADVDAYVLANLQYVRNFFVSQQPNDLHYLACQLQIAICFVSEMQIDDITVESDGQKPQIISHPQTPRRVRTNLGYRGFSTSNSVSSSRSSTPSKSSPKSLGSSFGAGHSSESLQKEFSQLSVNGVRESDSETSSDGSEDDDEDTNDEDDDDQQQSGNLGGFLTALQNSTADVVTSSGATYSLF